MKIHDNRYAPQDMKEISISDDEDFSDSDYEAALDYQKLGLFPEYTNAILRGEIYE